MKQRPIPDELLVLMAEKFRLLSDPSRLAILRALMHSGELTVSDVVIATGQSVANVSKHLKQLATAGLLARRKEGSFVKYQLDDPVIERICSLVVTRYAVILKANFAAPDAPCARRAIELSSTTTRR